MLFPSNLEMDEARLNWQCRRGMLELDLMLKNFVEKCYFSLPLKTKKAFHQLLNCQDQILLDYLMGQDVPTNKDVADVAKQIRDAAGPDA
jgi:antitoxin CptB